MQGGNFCFFDEAHQVIMETVVKVFHYAQHMHSKIETGQGKKESALRSVFTDNQRSIFLTCFVTEHAFGWKES